MTIRDIRTILLLVIRNIRIRKEVKGNERNIESKNNAIIYSNSVVVMLVFSLGGGRMTRFIKEEPVYEYEFIYNGEKMIADRCDSRFCIKDGQTYENVQWTRQIVGYEDVEYTPPFLPLLIFFWILLVLLSLLIFINEVKNDN